MRGGGGVLEICDVADQTKRLLSLVICYKSNYSEGGYFFENETNLGLNYYKQKLN